MKNSQVVREERFMKKISLFIAMSLDGYIADDRGGVDWLVGQGDDDNIDSYSEFVKDIDTVIMGWNTYDQIVTELSPNEWTYNDLTTYVITHRQKISSHRILFTDESPVKLLKKLRVENGKGIWICGGANLIRQLIKEDRVGVQGGKRSMKSKSKPLCCYFHSAYVSVRVVQVPKRGLDLSLLDSPTSTADNSVIFKADD